MILKPSGQCGRVAFSVFGSWIHSAFNSFISFNSKNEIKRIYLADLQRYSYCKAIAEALTLQRRFRIGTMAKRFITSAETAGSITIRQHQINAYAESFRVSQKRSHRNHHQRNARGPAVLSQPDNRDSESRVAHPYGVRRTGSTPFQGGGNGEVRSMQHHALELEPR